MQQQRDVGAIFLDFSVRKLRQLTERVCRCLELLSDEQIWARSSPSQNAVGNLVLHLCGNVRQWIGSGVGGLPDVRQRETEFSTTGGEGKDELSGRLRSTVNEAISVLEEVPVARLTDLVEVQGYRLTALEAIYHVVEHFAQHAAQIIYVTKHFTGRDLGFYNYLHRPHANETP